MLLIRFRPFQPSIDRSIRPGPGEPTHLVQHVVERDVGLLEGVDDHGSCHNQEALACSLVRA